MYRPGAQEWWGWGGGVERNDCPGMECGGKLRNEQGQGLREDKKCGWKRGQGTTGTEYLVPNDKPPQTPGPAHSHTAWNTDAGMQEA